MRHIIEIFARNTVFANILLLLIFLAGGMALKNMVREFFPESSLDMISISVAYPGADPEEIEEGISRKIEEVVEDVDGVKLYTTESMESFCKAFVEVKKGFDVKNVLDQIKTGIDAVSTFPLDAEKPVVSEIIMKIPVLVISLSGEMSERRLKEWAERLKDQITGIREISQAEIIGVRNYEIGIEVSENRLREYGLTMDMVADAIRKSSMNLPGGVIKTKEEEIRIRTLGRKYTGRDFSSVVVLAKPSGEIITLDRIAQVKDDFQEGIVRVRTGGKPSVLISVNKTSEEDSIKISGAVDRFLESKSKELPEGLHVSKIYDNTDMLNARINLLTKNGKLGLLIVVLTLWIFLNIRLSFWSAMGIPISLAGALAILWAMGETINMISLFGFIMVLGIVVDDAIVVGEAIYVHRKSGKPPLQAAVDGVCEVGMPVVAAISTSVVVFIPLLFISGIMGKFIHVLPVVVISCLLVSLVECLFLLPAHLSHLPDPNERKKTYNPFTLIFGGINRFATAGLENFVNHVYAPFLKLVLNFRYITLSAAIAILFISLGLIRGGLLKFEFMPGIDGFITMATVEFPEGTPFEITERAVRKIDEAFVKMATRVKTASGEPLIVDHLEIVGGTFGDRPVTGTNLGAVQVIMLESEKRGIHSKDILSMWEEEVGNIPGIKSISYQGMNAGPHGAPIEFWVQGTEMDELIAASHDLMDRLKKFDGTYQVKSDFSVGKNEMRLTLKPEARTLGLTVNDLARQVNAGFYGREAVRLQRGRDDVKVKVRYTEAERKSVSDLRKIRIRTASGALIPLVSVADITFGPGFSTITRTDGLRRISVSTALDTSKGNANEIFQKLNEGYLTELKSKFPNVYISQQGEKKRMADSFSSLAIGYPMVLLGIFIIISTMFRSYAQPFIIMFTIPFGLIGGVAGHFLLGYNLTIMSIFGMVALTGVVVNDAIVLIERVNENLTEGMRFFDAVIKGGQRRFRAIFLTTISTVGGLAPMILETDFQARFLIPMGISIAAGVAFATVLTLVLVPSLLAILNDFRIFTHYVIRGEWKKRELVEPARDRYDNKLIQKKELNLMNN